MDDGHYIRAKGCGAIVLLAMLILSVIGLSYLFGMG